MQYFFESIVFLQFQISSDATDAKGKFNSCFNILPEYMAKPVSLTPYWDPSY